MRPFLYSLNTSITLQLNENSLLAVYLTVSLDPVSPGVPLQATHLQASRDSSALLEETAPRENNRVRSMATQLQAMFEGTAASTVRRHVSITGTMEAKPSQGDGAGEVQK